MAIEKEVLSIDEAAKYLGVSRSTFNKIRQNSGLKEVMVGKRARFLKSDLAALLKPKPASPAPSNPPTPKTLPSTLNVFSPADVQIEQLETRKNVFDLRSLKQIDPYGALSLLTSLIARARAGDKIQLQIEDNQTCQYLKTIQFFYELERECGDRVSWNKKTLQGAAYQDVSILTPINAIRTKGGERIIAANLLKLLRQQGFNDTVGQYIGTIIGELADNAMTHSAAALSERLCYVSAKRFMLGESDCIIVGMADPGLGIHASLKSNPKYANLSDEQALLYAFRPFFTSWPDTAGRGKGLTDVLSIAMGNRSYVRVDSGDIGVFMDFTKRNDFKVEIKRPLVSTTGTRICLVLIDTEFEKCEREDVERLITQRTAKL